MSATAAENSEGKQSSESKPAVPVEDITKAEEIQDTASLEELIEEFNDPNISPERREELSLLLGDFFEMFEGETITTE